MIRNLKFKIKIRINHRIKEINKLRMEFNSNMEFNSSMELQTNRMKSNNSMEIMDTPKLIND